MRDLLSADWHGDLMLKRRKVLTVFSALLVTVCGSTVPAVAQAGSGRPEGTYVVEFDGAPVAAVLPREALASRAGEVRAHVGRQRAQRARVLGAVVPGVRATYEYDYALNAVAVRLTGRQAAKLAATPGVRAVTPNRMLRKAEAPPVPLVSPAGQGSGDLEFPDMARYLGLSGENGLWSKFGGPEHAGEGMIIGVVDSGIDPSSPVLAPLRGPVPDRPAKWRGTCDEGADPKYKLVCTNKVIGAAWFQQGLDEPGPDDVRSALATDGHGVHTAGTAAGGYAVPASIPGTRFTAGTVSGIAPAARVAGYKVCWSKGCPEPAMAAAVDRAVADGVDVISMSVGGGPGSLTGAFETAVYNATKAGVLVVGSAGNDGPNTVQHVAPWMVSVAAAYHDTRYQATLKLGDGRAFTGLGVGGAVARTGLVDGANAVKPDARAADAQLCLANTLDPAKVSGKLVVCRRGGVDRVEKSAVVQAAGGAGMVLYNAPQDTDLAHDFHSVPTVHVSGQDGERISAYAATAGATAELAAARADHVVAPEITPYSASGPDPRSRGDLLKPDLAAPTDVISGWSGGGFTMMEGTSAAAPHASGVALLLRALHPDWSPVRVKSAMMTTATTVDSHGGPIQRSGANATPLDRGAGQIVPAAAVDPGLVYDSGPDDWTAYMCALGDKPQTPSGDDACATVAKIDPSDLNYPALAAGDLFGPRTLTRTVTNVDTKSAVYRARITPPAGFAATVTPSVLTLAPGQSATYRVRLERTRAAFDTWSFGSLNWQDQHGHQVRSPIAVRQARLAAPETVDAPAASGQVTVTPQVGWTGRLVTRATLYQGTVMTGTLTGTDAEIPNRPETSPAVMKRRVHVPEGAALTRLAIFGRDHLAGSDLDLYVFRDDGTFVGEWGTTVVVPGSDEHVDLPPGDYDAYLVQFELPEGATSQDYRLWSWQVGVGEPDVVASVTPSTRAVRAGDRPDIRIAWRDLRPEQRYVGLVEYGDGRSLAGRTVLAVH